MPPRYMKKKIVRRKVVRRKTNPSRGLTLSGFPSSKVVRMRYVESVGVDPIATAAGVWLFRCNSIFDPNYTGSGHQPMGHDEWSVIYNHYSVLGSKIKVTFTSTDNVYTNSACVCTVSRQADTVNVVGGSGTRVQESGARYKLLGTPNGGSSKVILHSNFSAKKHLRTSANEGINRASFGSNPPEEMYYHCTFSPVDGSQNLGVIYMYIEIDYIVLMSERKSLAQS